MKMERFKKFLAIAVLSCLVTFCASGQDIDRRLWGVWSLDSVEITTNQITRKYKLTELLANKNNLPRNMLIELYFVQTHVGIKTTETFFDDIEIGDQKGFFSTNQGQLTLRLTKWATRTFNYEVEEKRLKVWYSQESVSYYLIFKLTFEPVK